MDNKVGERIRYHRLQRGMSQEKLALMAGINPAFLGHLERGLKSPTMTTLDKIIDALGLNYSEFFDDTVHPEDTESRKFYTDMIYGCIKRLPDEKLKMVADIMLKLIELAE
ncbi:MAG: helix-turn-helix domain-containing protein [Ruminococcus sp.]|nr:helix-turn-helix domain-containing protein [Ruminococcus sp.]